MVNRVIRLLVLSDFVLYFSVGLLAPIFAVFILKSIDDSSLRVVGIATAMYWIARTSSTVPLSKFMDRTDGERDEFYFMVTGYFILASIPLFYLLIHTPTQLYIVQLVYGLAASMAAPSWRILFTDHIDRGRTGYEWSLEDVAIGISTAFSAYIGSILADKFGFGIVMILLALLGYLSTMLLIPIYKSTKTLEEMKSEGSLKTILKKRKELYPLKMDGHQK